MIHTYPTEEYHKWDRWVLEHSFNIKILGWFGQFLRFSWEKLLLNMHASCVGSFLSIEQRKKKVLIILKNNNPKSERKEGSLLSQSCVDIAETLTLCAVTFNPELDAKYQKVWEQYMENPCILCWIPHKYLTKEKKCPHHTKKYLLNRTEKKGLQVFCYASEFF